MLLPRAGWRGASSALGAHNYRLYAGSMLFAYVGTWMARIAVDWLVYEMTGDIAMVGLAVAVQLIPTLLLGPWAGVVADRFSRRRTVMIAQGLAAVTNAVLAILVLTGRCETWQVLLLAAILGSALAFDGPSRSSFVAEMVGTARVSNAVSINAAIFQFSGLIGPAVSGVLIATVGSGWCILANAATSLIALCALALMRRGELLRAAPVPRATGQVRQALRYGMRKPTIFWPLILMGAVAMFGMTLPVLLTTAANETYLTGAAGYGLYNSLAALGAFAGALLSAIRRTLRLRSLVVGTVVYGGVTAFAGVAPSYALFLVTLVGIGVACLTIATAADAMIQLSSNPSIRGRIMSFYLMIVIGGQAIGAITIGFIAETFGATAAFLVAGGTPALVGMAACGVLIRTRRVRLEVRGGRVRITAADAP